MSTFFQTIKRKIIKDDSVQKSYSPIEFNNKYCNVSAESTNIDNFLCGSQMNTNNCFESEDCIAPDLDVSRFEISWF